MSREHLHRVGSVLGLALAIAASSSCEAGGSKSAPSRDPQVEEAAPPHEAPTLEDLEGVVWRLRSIENDELSASGPEVSLVLEQGRVSGTSGCNRYVGSLSPGPLPGSLSFSDIASTEMACLGPGMSLERRYLAALSAVDQYGFQLGLLALRWNGSDGLHSMLFTSAEPPP